MASKMSNRNRALNNHSQAHYTDNFGNSIIRDESYDETLCFNENMPSPFSVKTTQLQIELLNYSNENPVQYEGFYYFSP